MNIWYLAITSRMFFYANIYSILILSYINRKHYLIFQSLGMNMTSKFGILIQFIIPYFAVTIEAFVFCFAGEYLSTKVGKHVAFVFIYFSFIICILGR